jgi:hypothetical protein
MQAYTPAIRASQNPSLSHTTPRTNSDEFGTIFLLATKTCEAMIAAYKALAEAYQAINDYRTPRKTIDLEHPRALSLSLYKELDIPRLLPLTPPVHTTPSPSTFSPLPSYSHISIIISDYEPHAQACWDIGALNEFRAAKRGGKEGKELGLWRDWRPRGRVACWSCPGDGEDRGAFAKEGKGKGAGDGGRRGHEGGEGDGDNEEEEASSSSSDDDEYDSDTDSDEYDSDDEYEDIGVDVVFG